MRRNLKMMIAITAIITGIMFFSACSKDESITPLSIDERGSVTNAVPTNTGTKFFGITPSNELVSSMTDSPTKVVSSVMITGLASNEKILAIDFQPSTALLFGVSSKSLIYTIDPNTGKAVPVSATSFKPALVGSAVGMDFDPKMDQMRIITDSNQNLLIDPTSGKVVNAEVSTAVASHSMNSIAYTTTGLLYGIDMLDGKLYVGKTTMNSFQPVGSTGVTIAGEGGFDISPDNTLALAVQDSKVYNINLKTGQAQFMGVMDKGLIGVAIK